jgi:UDP-glucose:glycoprotein glucosyltransferase
LQAAERILNAAKDESLKIMAQLAQNFPLLARSIVRTTVRPALKAEIKRNQQVRKSAIISKFCSS